MNTYLDLCSAASPLLESMLPPNTVQRPCGDIASGHFSRYQDWNDAFAAYFFRAEYSGRPVYLQVDSETLREVGGFLGIPAGQAEDAFLAAIRFRVDFRKAHPFAIIESETRKWRKSANRASQLPPFIALLGACVLAASRMQRDEARGIASTNYYERLNEILGSPREGRPPDFDNITEYWEELCLWLDEDNRGRRGFCTARSVGGFRYIGWPLSQSLLREADRQRLPEFFRAARIAPRSEIDPDDVLGPLTRWCQQLSCPLPQRTKQLITSGSADSRKQIASIVAAEARLWGGEEEEAAGRLSAPIVLRIDPRKGGRLIEIQFFPRRPPSFPEGKFVAGRQSFTLTGVKGGEWYEPLPPDCLNLSQVLNCGLELHQGSFTLRWEAQPVIVAVLDSVELGGFASRPQVLLGQPCVVLCRDEFAGDVQRLLQRHAAPGWRQATGSAGLPPGWKAFLSVALSSRPKMAGEALQPLVPSRPVSVSLEGGLRLDRQVWLAGAEPVVHVSRESTDNIAVAIDDQLIAHRAELSFRIDLANLHLEPGAHELSVATRVRRFQTVRSGDFQHRHLVSGQRPLLGNRLVRDGARYLATYPSPATIPSQEPVPGELWVIGAELRALTEDLPERLPQPVTLDAGSRRYYLLGPRPGMVIEYRDPSAPEFACLRPRRSGPAFTATPPFPAIWVVRVSWKGRSSVRRIGPPRQPEGSPWPGGDIALWRRLIVKRYQNSPQGADGELWAAYATQARAF